LFLKNFTTILRSFSSLASIKLPLETGEEIAELDVEESEFLSLTTLEEFGEEESEPLDELLLASCCSA
jgi:hypothetical protein